MANKTVATLTTVMQLNNSKFKQGLTGSQKAMKGFSKSMMNLGGTIAAGFSVRAITNFTKASFRALDVQLKAERSLLVSLGGRIGAQQMLIRQSKELQKTTLYGDEETIRAAALIGTMVKEEETIKRLLPLVQDFATAKNMQLSAAADLVAKSIGSSTNALSRYGITIEGAVGSEERLESAVLALNKAFGGQAAAAADADKLLTQVRNAWGDLQEDFAAWLSEGKGGFISRALLAGIEDIDKIFEGKIKGIAQIEDFMKTLKDKSAEEQTEALRSKIKELGESLKILAQDRQKWQKDLDERGFLGGGRVAKMEINQIDEAQEALIELRHAFEDQLAAVQKSTEAIDDNNAVSKTAYEIWKEENDKIREQITLRQSLIDAINESAAATRAEADAIMQRARDYFAELVEHPERPSFDYLMDNDEEWDGGTEEWEKAAEGIDNVSASAGDLGKMIGMSLVNQFDQLGTAIGKFATGAEGAFNDLGNAILQNLGNILIMMGAQMGPAGIGLVLAGAAIQLGGGILRGIGNNSGNIKGGNVPGDVNFRIQGNDLVGVMDRTNYSNGLNT